MKKKLEKANSIFLIGFLISIVVFIFLIILGSIGSKTLLRLYPPIEPSPTGLPSPDKDGDGVPDHLDACPNEGDQGYGLESNGCPYAPKDEIEICFNGQKQTINREKLQDWIDKGAILGACPDRDSDGDGVTDSLDACPNDGNQGYGLEKDGCPLPPPIQPPLISVELREMSGWVIATSTSCITTVITLLGLISTTLLSWRKEVRDAQNTEIQNQKLRLELEKMKLELEKKQFVSTGTKNKPKSKSRNKIHNNNEE